jgi:glycosyltransferase involved in cell wall biosynthesis
MTGCAAHIAIVLPDFSSGGTERTAIRFAAAWVQRDRRVTMLCGSERGPARALVAPGVAVLSHRPEICGGPLYRIRLGQAFSNFVATIAPDLVFGIGNFHIPVLAWMKMALPKNGPPLVCRLSNRLHRPELDFISQGVFSTITRLASRRIDAIVAMSDALRQEASTILGRDDIGSIAEPNLPDGYVPNPMPMNGVNSPLILCAGRLERQKRFELALRAFAAVPPSRGARLLILGEGSRREALDREAAKLGISDKVEFAGYVADIQPHLARAQLFLCTSDYEGYPAVLVEAIAAGLKVVTTDCSPAIAEIMFDRSFGCVTGSDTAAMAQAIEASLDAPAPDPPARARLIAQHEVSRSADAYLDLFDRVVAERQAH